MHVAQVARNKRETIFHYRCIRNAEKETETERQLSSGFSAKIAGWSSTAKYSSLSLSPFLCLSDFPLIATRLAAYGTAHPGTRNFAALSWYARASAPGSINVRPVHRSWYLLSYTPRLLLGDPQRGTLPTSSVDLSSRTTQASSRSRAPVRSGATVFSHSADRDAKHSIIAWPQGARIKSGAGGARYRRALVRKYGVSPWNSAKPGPRVGEVTGKGSAVLAGKVLGSDKWFATSLIPSSRYPSQRESLFKWWND